MGMLRSPHVPLASDNSSVTCPGFGTSARSCQNCLSLAGGRQWKAGQDASAVRLLVICFIWLNTNLTLLRLQWSTSLIWREISFIQFSLRPREPGWLKQDFVASLDILCVFAMLTHLLAMAALLEGRAIAHNPSPYHLPQPPAPVSASHYFFASGQKMCSVLLFVPQRIPSSSHFPRGSYVPPIPEHRKRR